MENKWKHGKVHFQLPPMHPMLISSPGIKPIKAILDKDIGEEIVLLITEPKNKIGEFEGRNITRFMLKVGLVNTSYGPVCFLLFYFPDPLTGAQVTYENTVNPKDYDQLATYKCLANQSHWHVIMADDSGEVVNFFEFPNGYGLADTLVQINSVCENMAVMDFMSAKGEYEKKYTIEQLHAM